jgi:hypothetical protein
MMSYFRSKAVLQRTTFRGLLEVGKHLAIPVFFSRVLQSLTEAQGVEFP